MPGTESWVHVDRTRRKERVIERRWRRGNRLGAYSYAAGRPPLIFNFRTASIRASHVRTSINPLLLAHRPAIPIAVYSYSVLVPNLTLETPAGTKSRLNNLNPSPYPPYPRIPVSLFLQQQKNVEIDRRRSFLNELVYRVENGELLIGRDRQSSPALWMGGSRAPGVRFREEKKEWSFYLGTRTRSSGAGGTRINALLVRVRVLPRTHGVLAWSWTDR